MIRGMSKNSAILTLIEKMKRSKGCVVIFSEEVAEFVREQQIPLGTALHKRNKKSYVITASVDNIDRLEKAYHGEPLWFRTLRFRLP